MKSEKGITLISLTIYIIVMAIVVATVAIISTFFYTNVNSTSENINPMTEYTKFNSFFSDEVNHTNIKILECKDNYIVFDNKVQYTFVQENKSIYRNQVKVCSGIDSCTFKYEINNGEHTVIVDFKATGGQIKNMKYTLKH